jgi:hypothetical protein
MRKLNQQGGSAVLVVTIIALSALLIGALIFGMVSYAGQQDYKNNTDKKIAAAVKVAQDRTSTAKDNQFAEDLKNPLKAYKGPDTYGGVVVYYPKTWSGYIDTKSSSPLKAYFHPDVVPGLQSETPYALRIEVTSNSYDQQLQQFSTGVRNGKVKVSAYRAAKVPNTLGSKIEGNIVNNVQGVMVVFPLRDKALKVWTEAAQYTGDFEKYILPNLTFSP